MGSEDLVDLTGHSTPCICHGHAFLCDTETGRCLVSQIAHTLAAAAWSTSLLLRLLKRSAWGLSSLDSLETTTYKMVYVQIYRFTQIKWHEKTHKDQT